MKKIIGVLVTVMLMFTVCGCQPDEADVKGTYENSTENVSPDVETEKEFSTGKVNGNVYKNEFIGISYTLDEGWSFYDEERIRETNEMVMDMAGEEYEKIIREADIVYDMCATDSDQLNNININLEKIDNIQLLSLDIAKNFEAIMPTLEETLTNMGCENISHRIDKIEVDGKKVDALFVTADINGVNMYQTLFQKKCNGYLANITVATFFEDTTLDLIDNFRWIN